MIVLDVFIKYSIYVLISFDLILLYFHPCYTHACYIGTDRSLLLGQDTLLFRRIARDQLHAISHRHETHGTVVDELGSETGYGKLVTCR